jgi:dTDP-6-deoxy-L-talose 4-dehydrogenase (NAD+)
MKILITGSTGFLGRHIVELLVDRGHEVMATARNFDRANSMLWFDRVKFVACDLHDPELKIFETFGTPEILLHIAWPGLPNYKDLFHFELNLPMAYRFLKTMIINGTKRVLIAGTCFEYGMQNGPLSEDMPTFPDNPYGLAKDTLRRFMEFLQKENPFILQWVRLFYMFGLGQNENSLLASLDKAIDNGDKFFRMSGGEQLRDYLPVMEVAKRICFLVENPSKNGIVNCCSGKPISVRNVVEQHIEKRGAKIKLNLGYYPYSSHEPMAFWGNSHKLKDFQDMQ